MSFQPHRFARGAILAVAGAALAAAFLLAFREGGRGVDRNAAVFAMLTSAAAFNMTLTALRALRGERKPSDKKTWWITVVVFAAMAVLGNFGVSESVARLVPGMSSTILQTQIFFVVLGAWLFLREKITPVFLLGTVSAVGGFAVFAMPFESAEDVSAVGVLFGLVAAICFSVLLVWTRAVIDRIDVVSVNGGRLVLAVLVLALIPGQLRGALDMPFESWMWCALAAAFGPTGSRLCLMYAVRYLSASQTKLISLSSPVFAFAFTYLIYGAVPIAREVLGCSLILVGVLLPTAHAAIRGKNEPIAAD